MTVLITLTTAQASTGPAFDLFSNLDGYTSSFESNVNKAALVAGYLSSLVPDYTGTIRVASKGQCISYVDIVLQNTTTTTTTLPPTTTTTTTGVPCNATSVPGGAGITNVPLTLSPAGGIFIFQIDGQSVPDKFEIIHNNIKRATSSMSASPTNPGPFDNVYGDPAVPPDAAAVSGIPQFIGSSKGTVPDRKAEFDAANPGMGSIVLTGAYQQLIWWSYTTADFITDSSAILRVTGPTGTSWNTQRLCPPTTTTTSSSTTSTTTTTPPPTTTTTTTVATNFDLSNPMSDSGTSCLTSTFPTALKSSSSVLVTGSIVVDRVTGVPYAGGGFWFRVSPGTYTVQVNGSGIVTAKITC